jgi:hypothetical protein
MDYPDFSVGCEYRSRRPILRSRSPVACAISCLATSKTRLSPRLVLVGALFNAMAILEVGCTSIENKSPPPTYTKPAANVEPTKDCSKKPNYEGMLRTLCY